MIGHRLIFDATFGEVKIFRVSRVTGLREEVKDLYWFEEEMIHNFNGSVEWKFEIEVEIPKRP